MNQHDRRDQEVRNYVRNRMAGEIPPEFVGNVMNDVHRTPQRTRGPAWSIFATLGTVAAAAVAVVIGLNFLNDGGGVGSQPSPSTSATAIGSESVQPSASASGSSAPSASASAEATTGDGEFGPIHSMSPEEAFANAQTCDSGPLISNAEPTDLSYRISFPEGWSTNEEVPGQYSACTLFGPEPFEVSDAAFPPEGVEIVVNVPPGGDFTTDGEILATEEYTVDGVAALRYEIGRSDAGFGAQDGVVWIIAIGGGLPAVGNDRPYLFIGTGSNDSAELAERVDILDRMIATLDLGAE